MSANNAFSFYEFIHHGGCNMQYGPCPLKQAMFRRVFVVGDNVGEEI